MTSTLVDTWRELPVAPVTTLDVEAVDRVRLARDGSATLRLPDRRYRDDRPDPYRVHRPTRMDAAHAVRAIAQRDLGRAYRRVWPDGITRDAVEAMGYEPNRPYTDYPALAREYDEVVAPARVR